MNQEKSKKIAEILRVNHAGEFGAKVIYSGQIAALKLRRDHEGVELVEHMKKQEDEHFDFFDEEIIASKTRPTLMQPIWRIGGFALGFATAILDKKAAMCCTTAVEEVIDEHYQEQIKYLEKENLSEKEEKLVAKIKQFRAEELEHRDIAYENEAAKLSYFKPLSAAIKFTTKFAIAVSKKI
jgi:ubiquinone biosynthesis monooxygenase Coq7